MNMTLENQYNQYMKRGRQELVNENLSRAVWLCVDAEKAIWFIYKAKEAAAAVAKEHQLTMIEVIIFGIEDQATGLRVALGVDTFEKIYLSLYADRQDTGLGLGLML